MPLQMRALFVPLAEGFSFACDGEDSALVWEKRAPDAPLPRRSCHLPLEERAFELFQGGGSCLRR